MTAGISSGTSATALPTEVPTTVPTTEEPTATPTPEPGIWDQIAAWFAGLFRASAADPAGYVSENGMITLAGTTIFSTEKELAVSIEPYFTAAPKGSVQKGAGRRRRRRGECVVRDCTGAGG